MQYIKLGTAFFYFAELLRWYSCWFDVHLSSQRSRDLYTSSGVAQVVELLVWYTLVKPEVTGSILGVSYKFRIVWIIIPACLIKQPKGTLSRMYVQTYIRVKWVAVSVHSEAWNECSLECISLILAGL